MKDAEETARRPSRHGVGPFVTWTSEAHPAGGRLLRTSRRHRKGQVALRSVETVSHPHEAARSICHDWRKLWAPGRLGWWIAILFMVGAAHFALGASIALLPEWQGALQLSDHGLSWIFFEGSLFFTSAAYLQWFEAINNDLLEAKPRGRPWRFLAFRPRNLGYIATAVQLIGTLLFNANTGDALIHDLDWRQQGVLIWTPNLFGSICFLVASQAALMEISHSYWSWRPRDLTWWIAAINMLGSIFFMISALAAFVLPGGGAVDPLVANLGTLGGAVCFFTAAYLLIPELFEVGSASDDAGIKSRSPPVP